MDIENLKTPETPTHLRFWEDASNDLDLKLKEVGVDSEVFYAPIPFEELLETQLEVDSFLYDRLGISHHGGSLLDFKVFQEKLIAMKVELAEFLNEWPILKYWKVSEVRPHSPMQDFIEGELHPVSSSRYEALHEYADVFIFALSILNDMLLSEDLYRERFTGEIDPLGGLEGPLAFINYLDNARLPLNHKTLAEILKVTLPPLETYLSYGANLETPTLFDFFMERERPEVSKRFHLNCFLQDVVMIGNIAGFHPHEITEAVKEKQRINIERQKEGYGGVKDE